MNALRLLYVIFVGLGITLKAAAALNQLLRPSRRRSVLPDPTPGTVPAEGEEGDGDE